MPHNKCAMEADQPATSAEEQRLREALGRSDPDYKNCAATLMNGGFSKIEEVAAVDLATLRQDVPFLRAGAAARIMHSLSRTGLSHSSNLEDSHCVSLNDRMKRSGAAISGLLLPLSGANNLANI